MNIQQPYPPRYTALGGLVTRPGQPYTTDLQGPPVARKAEVCRLQLLTMADLWFNGLVQGKIYRKYFDFLYEIWVFSLDFTVNQVIERCVS